MTDWDQIPEFNTDEAEWGVIKSSAEDIIEDGNAIIEDKLYKAFKEKNCQTIKNILEIGLPKHKEQLRLITMNSFNTSAFIELIAGREIIEKAILVIFAINYQAAQLLIDLVKIRNIKSLELIISSVRNAGYSIKSKAVELLAMHKEIKMCFVNSHAKISAIKTERGNHYIIEGSGNYSYNGRIEQYVIDNDKELFNFTENWIQEMKKSMKNKRDFKIVN